MEPRLYAHFWTEKTKTNAREPSRPNFRFRRMDSLFKAVTRQRQDQDLNQPDVGPVVMYTVRDHRTSQMTLALPRVTLSRQRSASEGLLRNQAHERVQALADISLSALCCRSNETRALIANPPNRAQLGGTPYHSPKLHPGPCSSVGMRWRTDRQTHRPTHRQTLVSSSLI